jgi:hypothetical protein
VLRIRFLFQLLIYSIFTISSYAQDRPFLPIYSGMQISGDVLFQPGKYVLEKKNWHPIIVEGSNIDLNFNDAELFGADDLTAPHEYNHIAIIIRNAKHVNIRNLRIYRFKIAIQIENSSNVTIENCDISYMNRPLILNDIFHHQSINSDSADQSSSINSISIGVSIVKSTEIKIKNNYFNSNFRSLMLVNCSEIDILNNYFQFNASYPVTYRDCNSFSFRHNRLDYNFSKSNYTSILGMTYNSSPTANILLTGICNDFKIAFNYFSHGNSSLRMAGTHQNATIAENTIAFMDGSAVILKGININVLNNKISHSFNSIRFMDGTNTNILYNNIEHCDIAFFHSNIMSNNQILIQHNKISHQKVGFHLPMKKQKFSCNKIKSKIQILNNCFYENVSIFSSLSPPINKVFKKNSGSLIHFSNPEITENSKLISRLQKNNEDLKSNTSINSEYIFSKCEPPPPIPFTKHENGMSVDHGMYNYNNRNSMIEADYGPYDFRYPYATSKCSSTHPNQLLILGPINQKFTLIHQSLQDISGHFHDTLNVIAFGINTKSLNFSYTGHHFKNDRGTFIPKNDTFQFHYLNIIPESDWQMTCYQISGLDTIDSYYIDHVLHGTELKPHDIAQVPIIFSSALHQFNICKLVLTYKISETSNFNCSANTGTKVWINDILKMDFTSKAIQDFPEIKTMSIIPDELPYIFKFEFDPSPASQLPKVKWTK